MASGDVADNLICSLCLERFENPKFLECHHTYCEGCLTTLAQNSRRPSCVKCPKCRRETQLPPGGVSQLQTNFYVTPLLDSVTAGEVCKDHPAEKLRYYCITCDVAVCSDCIITKHKKHDAEDLKSAVSVAKEQLETDKSRLEQVSKTVKDHFSKIRAYKKCARDKRQSCVNELRERAGKLHKWVDEALDEALQSLESKFERIREPLCQDESEVESRLQQVQTLEADVGHALSTSGSTSSREVLSLRTDMRNGRGSQERLQQLTSNLPMHADEYLVLQSSEDGLQPREVMSKFLGQVEVASIKGNAGVEQGATLFANLDQQIQWAMRQARMPRGFNFWSTS